MSDASFRLSLLELLYQEYLSSKKLALFLGELSKVYSVGTLQCLAERGSRLARRAAVLALSQLADYESNDVLGRALLDEDRGVRTLAEEGLRSLWLRVGTSEQRRQLCQMINANSARRFHEALARSTALIHEAPDIAEAWNQRAMAHYGLGTYAESIADCRRTLELNPYHFGAAAGIGQCYLQLGKPRLALEGFRRALKLNPNLEGVRANIESLERTLGKK